MSNVIIVVEGCDGAGKTTLAHKLAEAGYLNLPYRRYPGLSSTTGPDDGIWKWWWDVLVNKEPGIYDRCPAISEYIYAPVMNRQPLMTAPALRIMQRRFAAEIDLTVFCHISLWVTLEEYLKGDQPQLKGMTPQRMELIWWSYEVFGQLWEHMAPGRVMWYGRGQPVEDIVRRMRESNLGTSS